MGAEPSPVRSNKQVAHWRKRQNGNERVATGMLREGERHGDRGSRKFGGDDRRRGGGSREGVALEPEPLLPTVALGAYDGVLRHKRATRCRRIGSVLVLLLTAVEPLWQVDFVPDRR